MNPINPNGVRLLPCSIKKTEKLKYGDRFIPLRSNKTSNWFNFNVDQFSRSKLGKVLEYNGRAFAYNTEQIKPDFTFRACSRTSKPIPKIAEKALKVLDATERFALYADPKKLVSWNGLDQVAFGIDKELYLYNSSTFSFELIGTENTPIESVQWNPENDKLAIQVNHSTLRIYDTLSNNWTYSLNLDSASLMDCQWKNSDEITIYKDGLIQSFEISNHTPIFLQQEVKKNYTDYHSLDYSPDGKYLAVSYESSVDLVLEGEVLVTIPLNAPVQKMAWSPGNQNCLAIASGNSLFIWDVNKKKIVRQKDLDNQIQDFIWVSSNCLLIGENHDADYEITISYWNPNTMGLYGKSKSSGELKMMACGQTKQFLSIHEGEDTSEVHFWDIPESIKEEDHEQPAKSSSILQLPMLR